MFAFIVSMIEEEGLWECCILQKSSTLKVSNAFGVLSFFCDYIVYLCQNMFQAYQV